MMSIIITIEEAQANLKNLIHQLAPGQTLIITENHQPVAKLVAENLKAPRPEPGLGKDSILFMAPDFDEPHEDMKGYME